MIIWRGWGILAAILLAIGLVLGGVAAESVGLTDGSADQATTWGGLGLVLAGVAVWFVGRWREQQHPDRALVDPKTGEQVVLRNRDDLFFIPMKFWGLIGGLLGAFLFVTGILALG